MKGKELENERDYNEQGQRDGAALVAVRRFRLCPPSVIHIALRSRECGPKEGEFQLHRGTYFWRIGLIQEGYERAMS